jgi:hypothetical protein
MKKYNGPGGPIFDLSFDEKDIKLPRREAKLHEVYQARVTPKLKWPHQNIVVNYDSQLAFPTQELAEKFVPYYVRELIEIRILDINQKYEAGVLQLHVFDGAIDVNGVEAAS